MMATGEDTQWVTVRQARAARERGEGEMSEGSLRMEELGEKMTSSRNCELTMMLSTSIESEQEDTEKQHDECFLGQIFGFLRSKYLGERQPLASIAETESTWKI